MRVEYLTPLRTEFHCNPKEDGKRWTVHEVFGLMVDGEKWEIPEQFWTDFASIPRLVWPIIAPYEIGYGPVPHDFGYFTGAKSKEYWDCVLWNCMRVDKIPNWKQEVVFKAVDLFGWRAWNKYRAKNTRHSIIYNWDRRLYEIYNWRETNEKRAVHWDQRLSGDGIRS